MEINIFSYFMKYFGIHIGLAVAFLKTNNKYESMNIYKKFISLVFCILLSLLQCYTSQNVPTFFIVIPMIIIYSLFLGKLTNIEIYKSIVTSVISLAIAYIASFISSILASSTYATFKYIPYISYFIIVSMGLFNIFLIYMLFKIPRFKHGFLFLQNEFLSLLFLLVTTFIIFTYVLCANYTAEYIIFSLLIISIITFIIIQRAFILYQKQKLQTQALEDCEHELNEIKQKLQTAITEKEIIIKSNHEFYHRQEALKNKLLELSSLSFKSEIADELSSITSRIDSLSKEYLSKTSTIPKLELTNIEGLDDMILYLQKECYTNNIEFTFKLDCNINNIVDSKISQSDLETLIGDLTRNAIIAINHSVKSYRGIMLVFGMKNDIYQIDIYDSGINFEINTLLNLGIKKCSTHLNEGGTGIGFITTFETLSKSNTSITIIEFESNNYSKCISIIFDDKNVYSIDSYRSSEIQEKNNGRIINFI